MPAKKSSSDKKKRVKKTTPSSSNSQSVSAPTPVEPSEPVAEEPVAESVVEPVAEPVAELVAPVVTVSPVAPSTIETIESEFSSIVDRLQQLKTIQASITSDLKNLHKTVHRHIKEGGKKNKRKRVDDPNRPKRSPSGFAKPSLISTQLCQFLNKPEGTEMARTEVTKFLTQYIKDNQLQDESNRRKIIPNKSLQTLLNVTSTDEVTYFNLQKYMKVHFPKSASALAGESVSVNA